MPIETVPFDAAEFIDTPERQADLLADAFASGNPTYVANALGMIARARGMSDIAKAAGVTREALYKALSDRGDPRLSTLLGVVNALGFTLTAAPKSEDAAPSETRARPDRKPRKASAKPKRLKAA